MKKRRMSILTVLLSLCAATFAQGLKDVYKDYFLIGVAVNQRNVTNAEQQALIKREFSSMTAENDMAPQPEGAGSAAFQIRHENPPKAYTLSGDQRGRHL